MPRARLLWITNQPAPYRVPAWTHLAAAVDLTIALVGRPHANRPEWAAPAGASFEVRQLTPLAASTSSDSPWSGVVSPRQLSQLLRDVSPSAVVVPGWGDIPSLEVMLLLGRRIPRIGFYGSTESTRHRSGPVAWLRSRNLRRFDAIVSYGTETTRLLVQQDGVDPARVVTGFNTVDVRALAAAVAAVRTPDASAPSGHRFLFVGQLVERKGAELAIEALGDERLEHDRLTIVGDGPERAALERRAQRSGLAGRVEFLGTVPVPDMPAVLATHQSLVMPSREEVWGLVANEALAAGLHAVISTSAGCEADLASHPGVFPTPATPRGVAEAMVASRELWTGWIAQPPILGLGPERLCDDVLRALDIATKTARSRGSRSLRWGPSDARSADGGV